MSEYKIDKNIAEFIQKLREKSLKKKKKFSKESLNKPVSFWIKKERLRNKIGKEFTIILKTRGCEWALGAEGGCSMCGYIQDSNIENVKPEQIINQFDYALKNKIEEIDNDNNDYILKIFNSGSFLDDKEITENVRNYIYEHINKINKIKELVVESRIEYISKENLLKMKQLKKKHVEIGIGLETVNDYFRTHYINKGLTFNDFLETVNLCKSQGIGVKAYLLFKPPFMNEIGAIDDCTHSIKTLINLNINTISINPLNIQKGSLAEFLWYQNRYRPPWFYSLFACLKKAIKQEDLTSVRVLSDPSGAGTKRGIHNCLKRECNELMINTLRKFVLNQDLSELNKIDEMMECNCKVIYQLQKELC
ncbi:MAG: archaeosine biosynthesis radical SAM protein RaSEA [Candidatus Hermodarchaeota archaeon]